MQRKFKFTKTSIESKALPPGADETNSKGNPVKDRIYWDTELPGFGVRVGRPRLDPDSGRELQPVRTLIAQKDIDGRTRRVTVGRYSVYTVEAARKRAMALLVQMNEGIDPTAARRAEKVASMTLAEAIDLHVQSMRNRGCAERSIRCVPHECGLIRRDLPGRAHSRRAPWRRTSAPAPLATAGRFRGHPRRGVR